MILLYLIPGFFILYQLYWFYLLHVFDFIASGLAFITIKINSKRIKVARYNLRLVFPEIKLSKLENILFKSEKLTIINVLLGLHQRFFLNGDTLLPYVKKGPDKFDKNDERRICSFAHYGIYYHFPTFKNLYGSVSFMYKNNIKWANRYFYNNNLFNKNKIYPYLNNEMSLFKRNGDSNNLILHCDHKSKQKLKTNITFLNQKVDNFFTSPVILSKALNIPIYFVFCKYDFDNVCFSHKIEKLEFNENETTEQVVQKIANGFTNEILKAPEQYMWYNDRFGIKHKVS